MLRVQLAAALPGTSCHPCMPCVAGVAPLGCTRDCPTVSPGRPPTALASLQLAVALGTAVYMWNADSGDIQQLMECQDSNDYVTSVSWAGDGKHISVGTAGCQVRCLQPGGAAQHSMPLLVKVSSAAGTAVHAVLVMWASMPEARQPSISASPAALSASQTAQPAAGQSMCRVAGRRPGRLT